MSPAASRGRPAPTPGREFVDGHPAQCAVVAGLDGAARLGDEVGPQRHRVAQRDVGPEARADGDLDAEFLVEFPRQRGGVAAPPPPPCRPAAPTVRRARAVGPAARRVARRRRSARLRRRLVRHWFRHCRRRYTVGSWPCYRTNKWMPHCRVSTGWERTDGALRAVHQVPRLPRRHRRGAPRRRARRKQGPPSRHRHPLADSDFRARHAFRGWHHRQGRGDGARHRLGSSAS